MSALDHRIRQLAREELAAAGAAPASDGGADRVADLEQQVIALTARVDELEKTSTSTSATKRTARAKSSPETSE
jgi:uncharacterized protein YceH (UPF0502 family)